MTENHALDQLRAAGVQVDRASIDQRQVLASLSEDEVAVLTAVTQRLSAAEPDVEAHMPIEGVVIF